MSSKQSMKSKKIYWIIGGLYLILLIVPTLHYKQIDNLFIMLFIYTILGESWKLIGGIAKQFSLGHAAFFGLGAFIVAYLINSGIPTLLSLIIVMAMVAVLSIPFGIILFRAKGPYFIIVSLALAEVLRTVFLSSNTLSGSEGIILSSTFFSNNISLYYLTFVISIISTWIVILIEKSKMGLALYAIGDNEVAATEIGINANYINLTALIVSAAMAASAGATYSLYIQYISPNDVFSIKYSLYAIFVCFIGGIKIPMGPFTGALVLSILEEILSPIIPTAYQLSLGIILILAIFFAPNGLLGLFSKQTFKTLHAKSYIKAKKGWLR